MAFQIQTDKQIVAIFLAIAVGVAMGMFTGLLVARVGIPSFVVTLALFLGWQGVLLQFIGNGAAISTGNFPLVNGISNGNMPPLWGWVFYVVTVGGYIGYTVMRSIRRRAEGLGRTDVAGHRSWGCARGGGRGRSLPAQPGARTEPERGVDQGRPVRAPDHHRIHDLLGAHPDQDPVRPVRLLHGRQRRGFAPRRHRPLRIRIACFAIGTAMAAIGGIAQASRLGSIPSDAGGGNTLLYAVAAAVIGGTSLFGGRGRARDAVIGGLVIAMIPNGLGLLPSLPASANFIITAGVLLLAAGVDAISRRRAAASGR